MEVHFNKDTLDEAQISLIHIKILRTMCPSKNAPMEEQQGYYNYYCQYYYTEEEEHKIETWIKTVNTVFWNMTKRVLLDEKDLLRILVIEDKNYKPIKQMIEILESRKTLIRASKIFNGNYYK